MELYNQALMANGRGNSSVLELFRRKPCQEERSERFKDIFNRCLTYDGMPFAAQLDATVGCQLPRRNPPGLCYLL